MCCIFASLFSFLIYFRQCEIWQFFAQCTNSSEMYSLWTQLRNEKRNYGSFVLCSPWKNKLWHVRFSSLSIWTDEKALDSHAQSLFQMWGKIRIFNGFGTSFWDSSWWQQKTPWFIETLFYMWYLLFYWYKTGIKNAQRKGGAWIQ